jgi:P-type Ca2+ transporter type 2C
MTTPVPTDVSAAPETPAYRQPVAEVAAALATDPKRGLAAAEVVERLARYGRNELPSEPPVPAWRKFLAQFRDPLTLLLIAAAVISAVAWVVERDEPLPYDAIVILAIVIVNALLGFFQERRAEQAMAALQAMSAPNARVLRDGRAQQIASAEVVPGDVLLIEEGDTLPADARVSEAITLRVAEAALTGESAPVSKSAEPIDESVEIADQSNMLFSSTAVSSGRGRAVVTATGAATEIGKIAGRLQEQEQDETPLQRELDRVGRLLGAIVVVIAVIIGVTIVLVDEIRSFAGFVEVLLLAVSLAVAAVPEGLTAITTIVLSLGTQRMARRNVIVRRLSAVEALGSTTVICTDKTGTLTKNEMTVTTVVTPGGRVELSGVGYDPEGEALYEGEPLDGGPLADEVRRTLMAGALANDARLVEHEGHWVVQGDPTEGALLVAAAKLGERQEELEQRFERLLELPFSSERKMMSTAHMLPDDIEGEAVVLAKGAPDVLLARCAEEWASGQARPLTDARRKEILSVVDELAREALRTIGVAYRPVTRAEASGSPEPEQIEHELTWLGVVGMIDPPRPEVKQSVATAQRAGIRVIMITGDHPTTAAAIAGELGIVEPGASAIPGGRIQAMDDAALRQTVRESSIYARVAPEHKLRIVQALKHEGAIVAMTGDGVNDAPALKQADIGVAMGITGTDVSKGASDMILTDDNFASIVAAVEEGRAIFSDIQKALRYLLSSNIGEVLVMFFGVVLAGLIGLVPEAGVVAAPLISVQILWINLLTDSGPALALGVEPEDPNLMKRPPRDPGRHVIDRPMWFEIGFVGVIMAIGTLFVIDWATPEGLLAGTRSYAETQTLAFTTLVLFQLFNAFNARAEGHSAFVGLFSNPWLWLAVAVSLLLQIAVVYTPFLQEAFSTRPLTLTDWLVCTAVASSVLFLRELLRLVWEPSTTRSAV